MVDNTIVSKVSVPNKRLKWETLFLSFTSVFIGCLKCCDYA